MHLLTTELWLPRDIREVFAFFSDARNLEVLTPPWLHFRILSAPGSLGKDVRLEYRIWWRWIPLRWRTAITVWEPPSRFVDEQVRGPYRRWVHEHSFIEQEGGTLVRDRVEYALPGWGLGTLLHCLVVGPDVQRIFAYRRARMQELFGVRERSERSVSSHTRGNWPRL